MLRCCVLLVSTIWFVTVLPRRGAAMAGVDHLRPARVLPAGRVSGLGERQLPRDHESAAHAVSRRVRHGVRGHTESMDAVRLRDDGADPHLCRGCQRHGLAARRAPKGADGRWQCRVLSRCSAPLQAALVIGPNCPCPILVGPFYLGLVAVMGYELSRDVLRASQLVHELQVSEAGLRESEARMSLAVDAADFGIWIRDLARNDVWASDKWRELVWLRAVRAAGIRRASCNGSTPTTAKRLQQAHAMALAGANGGTIPDGIPVDAAGWRDPLDLVPGPGRVRRHGPAGPDPRRLSRRHRAQAGRAGDAAPAAGDRPRRARLDDGPARLGAGARDQPAARRRSCATPRRRSCSCSSRRRTSTKSARFSPTSAPTTSAPATSSTACAGCSSGRRSTRGGSTWARSCGDVAALVRVDAATRQVKLDVDVPGDLPHGARRPRASAAGAAQPDSQRHGRAQRGEPGGSARQRDRAASTARRSSRSPSATPAPASPPTRWRRSSTRSSPPSRTAWAWAWRSRARSSRRTAGGSGRRTRTAAARRFVSRCRSRRRPPAHERDRTHRPHRRRRCVLSRRDLAAAAGERVRGEDLRVGERSFSRSATRMRRAACSPMCGCPA